MNPEIYYLGAYFATIYDYHKEKETEKNNFKYIKNYYFSIIQSGSRSILFHDHLNRMFQKIYYHPKIDFIKVDLNGVNMQPHDARYLVVYKYIQKNKNIDRVFITDVSDCKVLRNGEELFDKNSPDTLYIGKENENIYDNLWIIEYLKYIKNVYKSDLTDYDQFKNRTILNAGILGGKREVVLRFLKELLKFMKRLGTDRNRRPLDMIAFNYVAYTHFNGYIYKGSDLHTKFGHDEDDQSKFFKHK